MDFVQNFPFMSILISLFSGPLCSILDGKRAKRVNTAVITIIGGLSVSVLLYVVRTGQAFVYRMGHFPAPWGNEIRVGVLEAFMAAFFCVIMLLCMVSGVREREEQIEESKQNLYYVMVNLLLCSLLALIYTNDLFTAYVFVEINTISACGLIMIRQTGRTIEAAIRYMIMSLLGSGLLLLGICHLYAVTGQLLMSNIKEAVQMLAAGQQYHITLMVALGLMSVGLAIKSALYPFHAWLPDAYGYATLSSSAILSSLVSKGYIFLLIKIFYRVVGFELVMESKVANVLFVFGIIGMIMGSVNAIRTDDVKRMIAYSSVAQIGYIYMGLGLATEAGTVASIYHVMSHAATKSLLFVAAAGLTDASRGEAHFIHTTGSTRQWKGITSERCSNAEQKAADECTHESKDITGAAYRNKLAGVAFTVGALSMVGMPMFSGFISKLFFAQAAVGHTHKMLPTFIALAISTVLNALYFMKTVIRIYTPVSEGIGRKVSVKEQPAKSAALVCFILLNLILGLNSDPIIRLIQGGLEMFD